MGWYASTQWDLEFISEDAQRAALADEKLRSEFDLPNEVKLDELAEHLIAASGEESESWNLQYNSQTGRTEHVPPGLTITGSTGGKCYWDAGKASALAPYVKGTVEGQSDEGYWLDRFFGDGRAEQYPGEVTFPDDPEREKRKVWTCALADDDRPDLHPLRVTVHATELECFEYLREKYDPEGMSDDEPPVAIVEYLQREGWIVDVDVHEI